MKKFLLTLTTIFICTIAYAHTINWHVGNTILQTTTCDSGESVTPPTPPYKYGYHFVKWAAYTPIEYLESTGTQYIDTGVVPTENSGIEVDFYADRKLKSVILGGGDYSTSKDAFVISQNTSDTTTLLMIARGNALDESYFLRIREIHGNGTGRYKLTLKGLNVSIVASNDSVVSGSLKYYDFHNIHSFCIFKQCNFSGGVGPTFAKIYYLKLYDNDVLVRDFIPVLDPDGVPCMYDRVEKKFYYNAGTGDFIAGPVISE